jgi:two-component system LytT family response regulator
MKILIVDDERLARTELTKLLDAYPEVEEIAEAGSAAEAGLFMETNHIDLLFLDIHMPGKNGFEFLEELTVVPKVIFVTAYDEYAIKAFEFNALDYLLKPVDERRFGEAMHKFLSEHQKSKPLDITEKILSPEDKVFVKDGEKCWFVKLEEIALLESEGNYVRVYFKDFKPLILRSLNNLEKRLDNRKFFRANRKFIINLDWVKDIESWFNGGLLVTLQNGKQVEISRRQSSRLKEMMSL